MRVSDTRYNPDVRYSAYVRAINIENCLHAHMRLPLDRYEC